MKKTSFKDIQFAPENHTIKGDYRKWLKDGNKNDLPLLQPNIRLSANIESYQLIAQENILRGDIVLSLDEDHYIGSELYKESNKA